MFKGSRIAFSKTLSNLFLDSLREALNSESVRVKEEVNVDLKLALKPPRYSAKKYPLHLEGETIRISLPLTKQGTGTAFNVRVEIQDVLQDEDEELPTLVDNPSLKLGNISRSFSHLKFNLCVFNKTPKVNLNIKLMWSDGFGQEKENSFEVEIEGQSADVNWTDFDTTTPYSVDVAEGEDFVGRQNLLLEICNELSRKKPGSLYITGQKRVGKTSLAKAVIANVSKSFKDVIETDHGEFSAISAEGELKRLGELINDGLQYHLKDKIEVDFSESISDLARVAKRLLRDFPPRQIPDCRRRI